MAILRTANIFHPALKNSKIRYSTSALCVNTGVDRKLKSWTTIPGPASLPLIGQIHHFLPTGSLYGLEGHTFRDTLYKRYGSIVRIDGALGRPPMLVVFDALSTAEILRSENWLPRRPIIETFEYYKAKHQKVKPGHIGLIAEHGDGWKKFRSLSNPHLLLPQNIKPYETVMSNVADDLINRLKFKIDNKLTMKENFDFDMNLWSLESLGVVALGGRLNCLDPTVPPDPAIVKMIQTFKEIFTKFNDLNYGLSFWRYFPTKPFKRAMKLYEEQDKNAKLFLTSALKKIAAEQNNEPGILQKLHEHDAEIAFATVGDLLFAGVDTIANAMVITMFFLATNPDKQEKLRKEIKSQTGKKYLKACLKESLRIVPILGITVRETTKDYNVLGYKIPKGMIIHFCNESMSVMEKQYPRPFEYIPERWIVSKDDPLYHGNANPFASLPFGFGVRGCIGKRVSDMELETLLTKLMENFKIEWSGPPLKIETHFINLVAPPFNFKFISI